MQTLNGITLRQHELTAGPSPRESPLPLAMLLVVCCSAFVAALIGFARYAIRAGRAVTVPQVDLRSGEGGER